MTISNRFRDVAKALQPYIHDTYELLSAVDAVMGLDPETPVFLSPHDERVARALNSDLVIDYMKEGKRINAIKELRLLTNCGLREAKEAVEDKRVAVFLPSTSLYRP